MATCIIADLGLLVASLIIPRETSLVILKSIERQMKNKEEKCEEAT